MIATSAAWFPASAPGQTLDEARQQREAAIAERAAAAAQLQVLTAQEGELRAALASLDEALAYETNALGAAESSLEWAQRTAELRRQEATATGVRIDTLRQQASATMVKAYIGANSGGDDGLLMANDANEYVQRQHLLGMVEGNYQDDLDQLKALVEDQRRLETEAAAAAAEAAALRDEVATRQAELARQREAQGRVEAELRTRIVDFEAKVAALDASEAQLSALIQSRTGAAAAAAAVASASAVDDEPAPARATSSAPASASGYLWPADGPMTSGFGYRRHPVLGTSRLHAGVDIGASYGRDVYAAQSGVVILAGWNGGYGYCVMIEHPGGVVTLYGHLSELLVSEGEAVGRGAVVGLVGSTGLSTGPHLHFETHIGGSPEDPLNLVG